MPDLAPKSTSVYINHTSAEEALKALQIRADKFTASIKAGEAAGKNMVKEIQKLNKVQDDIKAVQNQIDKGLRPSFNQLQTTVSRLRNELKRMSEDAPGYAEKFKAFNAASTELQRMKTSIDGVQKSGGLLKELFAAAIPVIGIAAVTGFLKGAVTEALDAEKAAARLNNTLSNLGRTDVFDRLMDKADEMAARFTFLDNDDVVGVFEQLITYGKLTEQQINNLTPVIVDFAAKARISLAESTSVIIKALEGNGKALKEYGINIKDAGTESERLAIIMDTLKNKVDGAAEAFGETAQGSIAATTQEIKNLQEEIGTKLLPALKGTLSFFNQLIDGAKQLAKEIAGVFSDPLNKKGRDKIIQGQADYIKELAKSYVKDADLQNKSIADQKKYLEQRKLLFEASRKELQNYMLANPNDGSSPEFIRRRDDYFKQQEIILLATEAVKIANNTNAIGSGGNDKPVVAKKINDVGKAAEDASKKLVELEKDIRKAVKAIIEVDNTAAPALNGNTAKAGFEAATNELANKLKTVIDGSTGRQRLTAQLKLLDVLRLAELNNTKLTEEERLGIINEYSGKREDAFNDYISNLQQEIEKYSKPIVDAVEAFNNLADAKDSNKIFNINKRYEAEADANRRMLERKIIDQDTYDRKEKLLNAKKEKELNEIKRRQFERDKKADLLKAGISAAQSVLTTLKEFGPPIPPNILGIGAMLLTVATNAANIAAIAKSQPTFARGGVFDGPRHSDGGMPVYSRGRKVAELEGGEPILSRNTYRNNKPLVDALLYSSMYAGGQSISSSLFNRPHMGLNYAAVNKTLTVSRRNYERGGVFTADGAGGVAGTDVLGAVLQQLALQLQQPLKAYVAYSEVNAAKELDDFVKSNTTLTR